MSLPELEWQIIYGRLAWAVVLAALGTVAWPRSMRMPRTALAVSMLVAVSLTVLPGEASLAYWLGLAFQWPSGLLVGLCLIRLYLVWSGRREHAAMRLQLAFPIVLAGAVLYLDAIGLVSLGIYYRGFGPVGAPLLALSLALACAVAAILGRLRLPALALLFATTIFTVLRLPTGNLWDAMLDPILWAWSMLSLGSACLQWRRRRREKLPGRGYGSLDRRRV